MNIPMSWLRAMVNIPDSTLDFVQKATNAGIKVEGMTTLGEEITQVVVGRIASLERHPQADKLWVTQTDIGGEAPLQIITGADNLTVGDYIPVALSGATLSGGLKIKKTKMRGLESNGMLCSLGELGLTTDDFPTATADGILVLPPPLGVDSLGQCAKPFLGLSDEVLDFEVLSNRPDTNSVMGIARESAALYNMPDALFAITVQEKGTSSAHALVSVDIQDTARCPRYMARVVQNVKVGPSPAWLAKRLTACGLRPINNIVDITNYVMLEYGLPLHAFDITTVAKHGGKHAIVVRTARDGEVFTTLDGQPRTLAATDLLIADHEKPLAIAGVMGGENSMVVEGTATILFESACFDPASIRATARRLGMRTDASSRYEKGLDPHQAAISVARAMELVEQLACGDVVPGAVDNFPAPREPQVVPFNTGRVNALLGMALSTEDIRALLRRVGIKTRFVDMEVDGDACEALVPTFRGDVTSEVDIIEEVARFYGYDRIPARYIQAVDGATRVGKIPTRHREDSLKLSLSALGYYEAVTYPFESPKVFDKLLLPADDPLRNPIPISNPLGEDVGIMRSTTLPGLLQSLATNYSKRNPTARLFELAWSYHAEVLPLAKLPTEQPWLALAAYGPGMDFLSLKGDVEDLLATCINSTDSIFFEPLGLPYMHPGCTAQILWKNHPKQQGLLLGYLGQLHPQVAANYDIDTPVYVAALDVAVLHRAAESYAPTFVAPSRFPALMRDIALVVPEDVPAATIAATLRERGGPLLAQVQLFDVYQGEQVPAGHKSMAYSLRFASPDRTLSDEAVQKPLNAMLAHVQKKCGAQVRGQ